MGNWTVTATLNEQTATQVVEVNGTLLYEVDLMITEGIAVTTQPVSYTHLQEQRRPGGGGSGGEPDPEIPPALSV